MNRLRWSVIVVALLVAVSTVLAQPAINFFNQKLTVDSNGSLIVKSAAYGGSPGPATTVANLRVKADANSALIVAIGAGTATPDVLCVDGTNQDNCFVRVSAGVLKLATSSAGTTPSTLQLASLLPSASQITAGSGTGVTVNNAGEVRDVIYKITITSANFIAAALTADVTVATLPAKTFVTHALADLTQTFACAATCTTSTLSMVLGKTAGGTQYLVSFDADAATGQFGDALAELGASLTEATIPTAIGDLASWSATTAVTLRLTSGTGNIGTGAATNLSQGSVTVYLVTKVFP